MGLNVIVETLDRHSHPEWDDAKHTGDEFLFEAATLTPREDRDNAAYPDTEWYWRPTDFAAFRMLAWSAANAARWQHLANILERDPDYWIYLSV